MTTHHSNIFRSGRSRLGALALVVALGCGGASRGAPGAVEQAPAASPAPPAAPRPNEVELDLGALVPRALARGAVTAVEPAEAPGEVSFSVRLAGGPVEDTEGATGELLFEVEHLRELARPWGDRAHVSVELRPFEEVLADVARPARGRLVLEDARGRRMYLPNATFTRSRVGEDGWIRLEGRPSVGIPIPLGHTEEGFDPARIARLGIQLEAGRREDVVLEGRFGLRALEVRFGERAPPRVLERSSLLFAQEAARAERMNARWVDRIGEPAGPVLGVNLPHPTVPAPDGSPLQLYGCFLHAPQAWHGWHHDLRDERVQKSLRRDFAAIRETFGPRAIVRIQLFADSRCGIEFDENGTPRAITQMARDNLGVLLELANKEKVVLVPVLFDFLLADRWPAEPGPGERPGLITDADKRARLWEMFRELIASHADHPAVLVWEVMNEPENALAVVTPEHFEDLQRFLREGVEAIHGAGELATVGHRNPLDAAEYMRGRLGTDLGQAHYYPRLESHPAPYDLSFPARRAFGGLPSGWGEAPLRPDRLEEDLADARAGGHRFLLYWSWRGHEQTGDGFGVQPHRDAVESLADATE